MPGHTPVSPLSWNWEEARHDSDGATERQGSAPEGFTMMLPRLRSTRLGIALVATLVLTVTAFTAASPAAHAGAVHLCPVGQPCVTKLYETNRNSIFMRWTGGSSGDSYNVRWSRPGLTER